MSKSRIRLTSAMKEVIDIINSIQSIESHEIYENKLYIYFNNEMMLYSLSMISQNLELYEDCHSCMETEVTFVDYKTVYIKLLQ